MSKQLAKNITFLMQKHEIKNPNDLARRTHIPQPTLFRWMVSAAREPRQSSLKPLAEFFGLEVADLVERDLETGEVSTEVARENFHQEVSLLTLEEVKAFDALAPRKKDGIFAPVLMTKVSRKSFCVVHKGESMHPVMPDGSRIVVDPSRSAKHGDYILVSDPKTHFPIVRKMVEEGGYTYLQAENKQYETIQLIGEPQIHGVVCEVQIIHTF